MNWISVKDKLPEMGVEVIVLTYALRVPRIAFGHIVDKEQAVDYNGWDTPFVRYWMPCPTIPAEGV